RGQERVGEDRMDLVRGRIDAVHRALIGAISARPARIDSYLVSPQRSEPRLEAYDPRDRQAGNHLHRARIDPHQRPAMHLAVRDLAEHRDPHRVTGDSNVVRGVAPTADVDSPRDPDRAADPGRCVRRRSRPAPGPRRAAGSTRYSGAALRPQMACGPAAMAEGVPATLTRATTAGVTSAGR